MVGQNCIGYGIGCLGEFTAVLIVATKLVHTICILLNGF